MSDCSQMEAMQNCCGIQDIAAREPKLRMHAMQPLKLHQVRQVTRMS